MPDQSPYSLTLKLFARTVLNMDKGYNSQAQKASSGFFSNREETTCTIA